MREREASVCSVLRGAIQKLSNVDASGLAVKLFAQAKKGHLFISDRNGIYSAGTSLLSSRLGRGTVKEELLLLVKSAYFRTKAKDEDEEIYHLTDSENAQNEFTDSETDSKSNMMPLA